jgi:hypothetical protein
MVNGYAQTSEKIALSKLLGGRVLAPLRRWESWASSGKELAIGAGSYSRDREEISDRAGAGQPLTEMLVDKIVIAPHPDKIVIAPHPDKIVDGRRHYLIRAIPYQDPQQEAERLKAVHEARVKIVPRV